jgi:hypothetical protein
MKLSPSRRCAAQPRNPPDTARAVAVTTSAAAFSVFSVELISLTLIDALHTNSVLLRRGNTALPYYNNTVPGGYAQKLRMRLIRPTRTALYY